MTEPVQKKTRPSWVIWMHIAGIAYATSIWLFMLAFSVPVMYGMAPVGFIAFTVATFAFIGGWGRYMGTKY